MNVWRYDVSRFAGYKFYKEPKLIFDSNICKKFDKSLAFRAKTTARTTAESLVGSLSQYTMLAISNESMKSDVLKIILKNELSFSFISWEGYKNHSQEHAFLRSKNDENWKSHPRKYQEKHSFGLCPTEMIGQILINWLEKCFEFGAQS